MSSTINKKQRLQQLKPLREEIEQLYRKRIFYDPSQQNYKDILERATHIYQRFAPTKTPEKSAIGYVINAFKAFVNGKVNGRPRKSTQTSLHRTTEYRNRKRKIQYDNSSNKCRRLAETRIPNWTITQQNLDVDVDSVKFGYRKFTLHKVDEDEKHPSYGCDDRLHKLQGKICEHLNCINPKIQLRKKNQLQFHDECLIYLDWNDEAVCGVCAYAFWLKQLKF